MTTARSERSRRTDYRKARTRVEVSIGESVRIIRELLYHEPRGRGTDLSEALGFLNRVCVRKNVCFVVSDFIADDFEPALRIARRRHDLIPVTITDPRELEMPNVGFVTLEDPETGAVTLVDTANRRWRKRYTSLVRRRLEARKAMSRRMDTATLDVRTDQSYLGPLIRFFHKREMRR